MNNQTRNGLPPGQEDKAAIRQNWLGHTQETDETATVNVTVLKQLDKLRNVAYRKNASSKVLDPIIHAKLSQISS